MRRVRTILSIIGVLFLLLPSPGAVRAAEPPDTSLAFRPEGDEAQPASTDETRGSSHVSAPVTPQTDGAARFLDRTRFALGDPTLQLAQTPGMAPSPAAAGPATGESEGPSATELNRQLTNPVSSIWALSMQFNNYNLANHQWNYNMQFQPVLPVALTKDWNLITRPVIQFYNSVPVSQGNGHYNQTTAFGDLTLVEMLSPANAGNWLLGAGPTFIFPTATSYYTGQGRWQAGPTAVVGYLTKEYILGVFPQQWWSIGGSGGRANTSQMNLQPLAAYFFGEGWNIGYSGNILADWTAPSGNVWTVPLGLGIGKILKLGRLPIKVQVAGQWMAVHPSNSGQEWNIQVQITPVIPKLIKEALFE